LILEFEQTVQIILIQLAHAFLALLREHKVEERLLLVIVL
jgi:hypothetical protein